MNRKLLSMVGIALLVSTSARAEIHLLDGVKDAAITAAKADNADPKVLSAINFLGELELRQKIAARAHQYFSQVEGLSKKSTLFVPDPLVEFGERAEALRIQDQAKEIEKLNKSLETNKASAKKKFRKSRV